MTTISENEFYVDDEHLWNKRTWREIDVTSLRVPAESWAKMKAYLLKMCKKTGKCGDLSRWERRAKKLESKTPRIQKETERLRQQQQTTINRGRDTLGKD